MTRLKHHTRPDNMMMNEFAPSHKRESFFKTFSLCIALFSLATAMTMSGYQDTLDKQASPPQNSTGKTVSHFASVRSPPTINYDFGR